MQTILTGDRPTGKLHIGHYVGSLKRRVELQSDPNYGDIYIMIADSQALTDNFDNPRAIKSNVLEVALDYLAVGIDPKRCTLFLQSQIPELCELTFYYLNLVTVSRLKRNPTVKAEILQKGFESSVPAGFFCYPVSQAADITAFKATTVPAGEDQLPMIEQAREIVRKFNMTYKDVLVEPSILLPTNKSCFRLPGLDGKNKMSKSLDNCIYLTDSSDVIKSKIMSMYTDPNHIFVNDPGTVQGNAVFTYLDAFCNDEHFSSYWNEYRTLQELKDHYEKGGVGDVKIKLFLNSIVQDELKPIRERRMKLEKEKDEVLKIILRGSVTAREVASITLGEVRSAMSLSYK